MKIKLHIKRCCVLALLLWLTMPVMGQSQAVIGKVSDALTTAPIAGAGIKIKGSNTSTLTNENGQFTINAKKGDVIVVSYLGYESANIELGDSKVVNIQLNSSSSGLNEVVVVGYGKMKKTDMSSSQVTVTAADISRTVNTTFDQALQGRAANVHVTSNSGQPGAAPSVIIRGLSSLNQSSQPLYVIDGVQFKPSNPKSGEDIGSNFLAGLNPDDVETMNVLEGPAATSIYGAAGASGVILVTTKRGKAGETQININSLFSMQDLPRFSKVMNLREWATFRNASAAAGANATVPEFADPSVLGEGTDWQKALFRRTLLHKDVLSLSGGNEKTTFYLSGEYFTQEGVAKGSGFDRYSTRLNLDNQTRSWLKIGTNLSFSKTAEKINTSNGDILNIAIGQNPSVPVKNPDGSWGGPTETQFQYTNPVALAEINDNRRQSNSFTGGAYVDITLFKGLVFHADGNGYIQNSSKYNFEPSYTFGGYSNTTTESDRERREDYWWGLNQRLQYENRINKHSFTLMAGHEAQKNGYEYLSGKRSGYVLNNIPELGAGSSLNQINNGGKGANAKESYFGRLNYVFNDRYIVMATYRADASSNFGPNYKWGKFPSVSVAWRASQEDFLKQYSVINDLKFRVEYGLSGNENAGGYYATLSSVPTPFGGGTGFLPDVYPNPNLHWETTKTLNLGFDLSLFSNRLQVVADAYDKRISDLLVTTDNSYYLGGAVSYDIGSMQWPTTNVGELRNKGFGITLNTVNIDNKDFKWKSSVNYSLDRNKVTKLDNNTPFNSIYKTSSFATLTQVGSPAGLFTGYIAEGIFQDIADIQNHAVQTSTNGVLTINPTTGSWVGDIKYLDRDKNGVIDEKDRQVIGNPWPKFTLGFNNAFTYKNFDLNIFLYGSFGNDVLNYQRYRNEQTGGTNVFSNLYQSVANFANPSNRDATALNAVLLNPGYQIARIAPGNPNGNNRASQWYIEDGSYLRCKNIALNYNIPAKILSGVNFIRSLKVGVNVQNAFTITGYSGLDPEVGQNSSLIFNVDDGRYPSSRMYSFNLSANF